MKIGTRGSDLATTQTSMVAVQLAKALGRKLETIIIQTQGDRVTDRPLRELEGRGYFTKEIEEALLAGTIDLAVHSFKDMPSQAPAGLALAAVSVREDPADLLIVRPDAYEPTQGKIPVARCAIAGTSAVRRESQVCALRPDLITRDLRGNVPTRVEKLAHGQYDAIFLASAGVRRLHLDLSAFKVVRLDPTWFVPSPGQGALAIQMRADDPRLAEVHAALNDPSTATATWMERAVQAKFGGGCGLPLGVYAHHAQDSWHVYGFWGADRVHPTWAAVHGDHPEVLAEELFASLGKGRTCTIEC
jgi:hydroxymethylbilane synthase